MSDDSDADKILIPCPNCGSREAAERERETYALEDRTMRRVTLLYRVRARKGR